MRSIGWTSGNAIQGGYFNRINTNYLTTLGYTTVRPVSASDPTLRVHYGDWTHLDKVIAMAHGAGKRAMLSLYDDSSLGGCFKAFANNPTLLAQFAANVAAKVQEYSFEEVMIDHEDWSSSNAQRIAVAKAIWDALHPLEVGYYSAGIDVPIEINQYCDWVEVAYNPTVRPPTDDSELADYVNYITKLNTLGWPKNKLVTVFEVWAESYVGSSGSGACSFGDLFAAGLDVNLSEASASTIDSMYYGPNYSVPGGKLIWQGLNFAKRKVAWMKANGYEHVTFFTSDFDTIPNDSPSSLIRTVTELMGGASLQVTFSGTVSGQAQEGEVVTIRITRPDGQVDAITATTTSGAAFTRTYDATLAGDYSAVASIPADSQYQSATSAPVTFSGITPALLTRTITLNVG